MTDQNETGGEGFFSPATRRAQSEESELDTLRFLAQNMYWSWNRKIGRIFSQLDSALWDKECHNPVSLLQKIDSNRIDRIVEETDFRMEIQRAREIQAQYLRDSGTWFQRNFGSNESGVAYFSAEFGFAECFKIYSGGLGILSGDHLKSASDLGIPIVGVGLFYNRGYFSQGIDQNGWQTESYPENHAHELPCDAVLGGDSRPLLIQVPMEKREVCVRIWKVSIGRVPLFLLDSDIPGVNSEEDCRITSSLYGGDSETRIKQEMILGFGGVTLLRTLGISPTIYHVNEGHAAFVTLARIRDKIEERGGNISFQDAKNLCKKGNLFTTHTPVPAGIDVFHPERIASYLSWYCEQLRIPSNELLELGRDGDFGFNMAALAIKLSENINAVSKLHREVASKIWSNLCNAEGKSIACVTNGVHIPSWISKEMAQVYDEYLGANWVENCNDEKLWSGISKIPDEVLWAARCRARKRLVEYVGGRVSVRSGLDQDSLTVGFSRRFATYKRANLILRDRERLGRILGNRSRPVQLIFAGKAHPRDHEAKRLIQEIVNSSKSEESMGRVAFLEDYDITIAKELVSGVDVWLNNPRRPQEACGTSGMKTLANGVLNLSVLDGWWAEACSQEFGWAIGGGIEFADHEQQDGYDSSSLYDILERQVVPEFYERENDVPRRWVARMKKSISSLSPRFSSKRMVVEYATRFYFKELPLNSRDRETA